MLGAGIDAAAQCGAQGVEVITNAFWASSFDQAARTVNKLRRRGVTDFIVSTDKYHQRFIGLDHVLHLVSACNAASVRIRVQVSGKRESPFVAELLRLLERAHFSLLIQPVIPFGRGKKLIGETKAPSHASQPGYCLSTESAIVFPDGNVYGCCGPASNFPKPHNLHLGNLRNDSLMTLLDRAYTNPFLTLLRLTGPEMAAAVLKKRAGLEWANPGLEWPCHFCQKFPLERAEWHDAAQSAIEDNAWRTKQMMVRLLLHKKLLGTVMLSSMGNPPALPEDSQSLTV